MSLLRPVIRACAVAESLCSIEGCTRLVYAKKRKLCKMHYRRFQNHGDPLIVLQAPRGEATTWVSFACLFEGNDCLIWPFGSGRYGAYSPKGGSAINVHHVVCERVHGPAPEGKPHAAHRCGVSRCVNPKHLYWASPKENEHDKVLHGTVAKGSRHGSAKLSEAAVESIRGLKNTVSSYVLAKSYGVSPSTIQRVWSGKIWREI